MYNVEDKENCVSSSVIQEDSLWQDCLSVAAPDKLMETLYLPVNIYSLLYCRRRMREMVAWKKTRKGGVRKHASSGILGWHGDRRATPGLKGSCSNISQMADAPLKQEA